MSYNQPGLGDVHVDRPLTQISIAFLQSQDAWIADRAFPVIPVPNKSDKYFTLERGAFLRDDMEKRAPGTRAATANYTISTDSFNCDVWALAHDLSDQVLANYDSPLQADREVTEFLTGKALLSKERQWNAGFFAAGVWTGDLTGVDSASPSASQFGRWDRDDSDPIETVRLGMRNVHGRTGFRPNKLVLGRKVFDDLLDHPDIVGRVDRGQTSGPARVMREQLAALFELDEILVMDGIFNSAAEGAANSLGFVGGKSALLMYTPPAPGLMVPSAGYTFSWSGLLGAGALGARMKRIRMEPEESSRLEIQMAYDHKLVSADLGQFFAQAVS